jgi:hypothetical protein
MSDHDTTHLVFRHRSMHNYRKAKQDPRQVRCLEDEQPQKAEHGVWVLPAPDVDEGTAQRRAQERHAEHGRNAQ